MYRLKDDKEAIFHRANISENIYPDDQEVQEAITALEDIPHEEGKFLKLRGDHDWHLCCPYEPRFLLWHIFFYFH